MAVFTLSRTGHSFVYECTPSEGMRVTVNSPPPPLLLLPPLPLANTHSVALCPSTQLLELASGPNGEPFDVTEFEFR